MKENYENRAKTQLLRRTPVIIRLDGKAFHTFTKGFEKPFDKTMVEAMQATMLALCKYIQGCVLGYTQSDEITLVLTDYTNLETSAWFNYDVQKICSVSASMATLIFNKYFSKQCLLYLEDYSSEINDAHNRAISSGALFDARCFNIPKEEVTNYFYWRQLDAIRNSIQMIGQANFSHRELQFKTCEDIKDMLYVKDEIIWELLPIHKQRGSCCIKQDHIYENILRKQWVIDNNIPLFKEEGRDYIEVLVNC